MEPEIRNLACRPNVHPRTGAVMALIADEDMRSIDVRNGQVALNQLVDTFLKVENVDTAFIHVAQDKAMADVGMFERSNPFIEETEFTEVLCGVCHTAENNRFRDDFRDVARVRSEKARTRDNDFFADADEEMRIAFNRRIEQVEMLHDDALAHGRRVIDGLHDVGHLCERGFKAHVDMVRMR